MFPRGTNLVKSAKIQRQNGISKNSDKKSLCSSGDTAKHAHRQRADYPLQDIRHTSDSQGGESAQGRRLGVRCISEGYSRYMRNQTQVMNAEAEIRRLSREVKTLTNMVQTLMDDKSRQNELMTVSQFAKAVGCSRGTVINRIKAGIYGAERHGKLWYLPAPK